MAGTINLTKLQSLIDAYKADFSKNIENEIYKWKAIAHFQKHWDINAANFTDMLKLAFGFDPDNLLIGAMYYPKLMIWHYSEFDEDFVRQMFIDLFDENKDLAERINAFVSASADVNNRRDADSNHYQDHRAISTYLWLKYPEKYYIYKADCVKALTTHLGIDYKRQNKLKGQNVVNVYDIYDQIANVLMQDEELRSLLDAALDGECYSDPMAKTLVVDFAYYLKAYYNSGTKADSQDASEPRTWLYTPGEGARFWEECQANGKMYLGWDDMGDLSQYASKEAMAARMTELYGNKSSFMNDSLATFDFAYTLKAGDIIFVKKGIHQIIGRGVVIGDYEHHSERSEYKNVRSVDWHDIGEWGYEEKLVQKTLTDITKYPHFVKELCDLVNGNATKKDVKITSTPSGFWWLNANPKFWSLSEWTVGAEQFYTLLNENGRKRRIYQNFVDAKEGDAVICYESNPTKQILCLAIVSKASDGERLYFKKVETLTNGIDYATFKGVPELQKMECLINPNGSFFNLTAEEYDVLMDIIREYNPISTTKESASYTKDDFLSDVYISESEYDDLCGILEHKRNIILQGAPGVGKTWSARRLAYSIMGERDDERIGFVQFHQNYSYEDFVMGYKPNSDGGFDLQRGIFYKFCIKAANDPDRKYFFIIDEINRGNLSKIFGELLMLIEKDYRFNYKEGKGTRITLAYNDERFAVPENLYIIGMMNTADRSLAMIDYALRRRFSFYPMAPGFDSDGFKYYQETLDNDKFNLLIDKVKELNKDIVADGSLGLGFEIGHSYFCNQEAVTDVWLRSVVNYEIVPMLEEYWFDNRDKVDKWSAKLRESIK